ncbi:glycosyltransferase [Microbulbifer sp. DLAB2-AA]|uniref:glycosyltransferase n=1 Tax=Microbulbifer sp. DLAB2-AA TaxID=3243394 RepID=UPI00403980E8
MKNESPQTICLNMIVKNETKVIQRCLMSLKELIDYWVIVDTGSTDGTQTMIQEFMQDIPGELIERPWVDFGRNRSEALEYARGKADYVFTIDADEVVDVEGDFCWPKLTADSYLINFDDNGLRYQRCQLVKNALNWNYKGVLHEYVNCPEAKTQGVLEGFKTIRYLDGSRSSDPNKFKKDALLLESALLEEPDNERYVFYLAQSYRDAGEIDLAIRYYQKRVAMERWDQEVWYSLYQLALLFERRGDPWPQVLEAFLRAYEYRPSRAEPLYRIMMHYMGKEYHTAYLFGQQAIAIPTPDDILFVEHHLYTFLLPLDYGVCCYWTGHNAEAIRINNQLLVEPNITKQLYAQVVKNRRFSLDLLYQKNQTTSHLMTSISVFVTFHNPGQEFDKTVSSLIYQEYDNFNVIFIDNGSTNDAYKRIPQDKSHVKLIRQHSYNDKIELIVTNIKKILKPSSLCIILDENSCLENAQVLQFLYRYYNEHNCQLLLSQYRKSDGSIGHVMPCPDEEAFKNKENLLLGKGLTSFRAALFYKLININPSIGALKDKNSCWQDGETAEQRLIVSLLGVMSFEQLHFTDQVLSRYQKSISANKDEESHALTLSDINFDADNVDSNSSNVDDRYAKKESVALIIPNYNNAEYLKLCLVSILKNTDYPYHIVVSDAGSDQETWGYLDTLKDCIVLGSPNQRLSFSEACNAGINASSSKYFAILNSDIVVSRGWLTNIIEKMETIDRLAVCGVLSNCDRGWLNDVPGQPKFPMRLENAALELTPGMKKEQIEPYLDELFVFMENSNRALTGKYMPQQWVAAYATVFARSAVDESGLFDPIFKNGCEDLDICRRIRAFGFEVGQSLDSFVFHFGGISRGAYQDENKEVYDKEDHNNHHKLHDKWKKKNVVIYTGPAWEKWNRETVDAGMAGSETWAAELGAVFSRKGFNVTIYNDCPENGGIDRDGVQYKHFGNILKDIQYKYIDLCILSRTCDPLSFPLRTNNIYIMVHDILLPGYGDFCKGIEKVKKFACLSEWHRDFFSDHYGVAKNKIMLTSNGVDQSLYADASTVEKKNQIFYSSSPDRGLLELLDMFPRMREKVPDLTLKVAYGFKNWESSAKLRLQSEELKLIESIKGRMMQPGVEYVGRVNKKELSKLQKESKAWLYPTWFSETFCITAVEAGLAECAIVTTPYAGLLTTLGDAPSYIKINNNIPVEQQTNTAEYQNKFIEESVKILSNDNYRIALGKRAKKQVSKFTWEYSYESWINDWLGEVLVQEDKPTYTASEEEEAI